MATLSVDSELCFVTVKDASKEESRRNGRLAKSHTAKFLNKLRRAVPGTRINYTIVNTGTDSTDNNVVAPRSFRQARTPCSRPPPISHSRSDLATRPDLYYYPSCPRTLSPVIGGLVITTFDWTSDLASVNMIQYRMYEHLHTGYNGITSC
jgi:hypothetical protein